MAFETGVHVTSGLPRPVLVDTRVPKGVAGSHVRHQVGTGIHVNSSCFQTDPLVFGMRQIHIEKTPGLKRLAQQPAQNRLNPFGCKTPVDRPVFRSIV